MEALIGETFRKRLIVFYIPLFMFLVALLFPFYWMMVTSVKPDVELYNARNAPFFVWHPTLSHWLYLFQNTIFTRWAWNTFCIATASTVVSLFAGVLAGYALSRLKFPGSTSFGIIIFITYLVPPTLLFIPLASVIAELRLLDSPWALILTYPTFLVPFSAWLLMGYFKTIPRELEECALVDGATRMQTLWKIVLPMSVPGIICALLFSFTFCWNEFIYGLTFISQSAHKTAVVGVTADLIRGDIYYWARSWPAPCSPASPSSSATSSSSTTTSRD